MDLFTQIKMAVSVKEAAEYSPQDHQHSGSDEAGGSCRGFRAGDRQNPSGKRHFEAGRQLYRGQTEHCAE